MKQRRRRKLTRRENGASNRLRSSQRPKSLHPDDIFAQMDAIYRQNEELFKRLADS